jgi:hypothetical protein
MAQAIQLAQGPIKRLAQVHRAQLGEKRVQLHLPLGGVLWEGTRQCETRDPKSSQIIPNHPKSSQITPNHPKSSQIIQNRPISSQIIPNHPIQPTRNAFEKYLSQSFTPTFTL